MRERPIIMSGESVRAITAARKSQTRRVIKDAPRGRYEYEMASGLAIDKYQVPGGSPVDLNAVRCAYGKPGDRLWVRETWFFVEGPEQRERGALRYRADEPSPVPERTWRSPLFMPRWASRLTLEVTAVRVERLCDISDADALAEGVGEVTFIPDDGFPPSLGYPSPADGREYPLLYPTAREAYRHAWDALNAKRGYPWTSNPWVWVVTFRRVEDIP